MHIPSNGRRSFGRRLTALAARWPIAAALLLVGMAALLASPAQADTVTLVSNFGSVTTFCEQRSGTQMRALPSSRRRSSRRERTRTDTPWRR